MLIANRHDQRVWGMDLYLGVPTFAKAHHDVMGIISSTASIYHSIIQ